MICMIWSESIVGDKRDLVSRSINALHQCYRVKLLRYFPYMTVGSAENCSYLGLHCVLQLGTFTVQPSTSKKIRKLNYTKVKGHLPQRCVLCFVVFFLFTHENIIDAKTYEKVA